MFVSVGMTCSNRTREILIYNDFSDSGHTDTGLSSPTKDYWQLYTESSSTSVCAIKTWKKYACLYIWHAFIKANI